MSPLFYRYSSRPLLPGLLLLLLLPAAAKAEQDWYQARPELISPAGYFLLFYSAKGAMSYQPMTRKDLPSAAKDLGNFRGKTCQWGISVPLSLALQSTKIGANFGDGSYFRTIEKIRREHPELSGLYDIKADAQTTTVLGIVSRLCMIVNARGFSV